MTLLSRSEVRKLIQLTHSEKMQRKHEEAFINAGAIGELDELQEALTEQGGK